MDGAAPRGWGSILLPPACLPRGWAWGAGDGGAGRGPHRSLSPYRALEKEI